MLYGIYYLLNRSMTRNSNMIGTIDSAVKKNPIKRHITCPKVRFGKKVMFSGPYGSLEVIWRSFDDSKTQF